MTEHVPKVLTRNGNRLVSQVSGATRIVIDFEKGYIVWVDTREIERWGSMELTPGSRVSVNCETCEHVEVRP